MRGREVGRYRRSVGLLGRGVRCDARGAPELRARVRDVGQVGGRAPAPSGSVSRTAARFDFRRHDEAEALAARVDAVLLAVSAEQAMTLAPKLAAARARRRSLGRVPPRARSYPKWYGFEHTAKAELERAWYGLPELFGPPPRGARIVANPGCYATASLLAIAPLLHDELATGRVIVDGKSGVSGAGRRADEAYSFVELAEEVRAYKVGEHQHTPEIARHAGRYATRVPQVVFTPHLVPLRRGLVVTAYLAARAGATTESVRASLERAYASSAFVRVVPVDRVTLHATAGTPYALVGAYVTDETIVTMCAIDNLMKGAASQAIQNLNLWLGLAETAGLETGARFAP